jgi:hypothetical protein
MPSKAKSVLVKKVKSPAKKITKSIAVKKVAAKKSSAKKITKKVGAKKVASKSAATKVAPAKKKLNIPVKKIAVKKVASKSLAAKKAPTKNKAKSVVVKSTKVKSKNLPEIKSHGEDLHFIPVRGEKHPFTPMVAHEAENEFHHKEEVAFHQENQKVRDALSSRKSPKRRM